MQVDENIISAIRMYFLYALPPGSCTELLLRGKFDEAEQGAHPKIRGNGSNFSTMFWSDHVRFVETLVPGCCKNENYDSWTGYANLTPEEQSEVDVLLTLLVGSFLAKEWTTDPYRNLEL